MKKKYLFGGLAAAFAIVSIVGFFLAACVMSVKVLNVSKTVTVNFSDLLNAKSALATLTYVFSIITFILSIALVILAVGKMFVKNKIVNLVTFIVAIVAIVCGVLALVFNFAYGIEFAGKVAQVGNALLPAVGAYLLSLGAIASGAVVITEKYVK